MSAPQQPCFAQIVVQVGAPNLRQPFTYRVPAGISVQVGDCVLAPFGPRELIGYVVGISDDCEAELVNKIRDIAGKIENATGFDQQLWDVAKWVQDQTLCDAEGSIRLIAPDIATTRMRTSIRLLDCAVDTADMPEESAQVIDRLTKAAGNSLPSSDLGRSPEITRAVNALRRRAIVTREVSILPPSVREKTVRLVRLSVEQDVAAAEAVRLEKRSKKQSRLLRELASGAALSAGSSIPEAGRVVDSAMREAAQALAQKGFVTYHEMGVRRDPFGVRSLGRSSPPPLTDEQAIAAREIGSAIEKRVFASFLLFGVTGSGKTEVYMDAIARVRAMDKGAIVLVPEISLSAQLMDILKARFGDKVAVLHSALSTGEWFDEWQRIRHGDAMVVVGARSAIFAPLPRLGLVIVDEEHDGAYKQDTTPRYNARDTALFRARQTGAVCVLGSATPSIESYFKAKIGVHTLLTLEHRVQSRQLPPVQILDLRSASKAAEIQPLPMQVRGILSHPLLDAIGARLQRREQTILFLNRRGFAQFLLCRDCGFAFQCPNCAVSLTFHRGPNLLQCHHCNYQRQAPERCPKCSGSSLKPFGIGTEKVEEAVRVAFPDVRTLRMDRDTVTRKGSHGQILHAFKNFEADILIGTQMVAKGLDFANVTLVGVINADTALNLPDFRASERSFQLLMQVSGRAGRGETAGEVMVQTFNPDHDSVRLASTHDYKSFYKLEIANRRELHYPPFATLANLVCSDEDETVAVKRIHAVARKCKDIAGRLLADSQITDPPAVDGETGVATIDILGPVACPLERLRNRYRWHLLARCSDKALLLTMMRQVMDNLTAPERSGLALDIDPMTML